MAIQPSQNGAELSINTSYQRRVKFFMQKAAVAIIGEATPIQNRHDYSVSVLAGDASILQMAIATTSNATILSSINLTADDQGIIDNDLEFVINSLWDDFASQIGDVV